MNRTIFTFFIASLWNPVLITLVTLSRGYSIPLDLSNNIQLIPAFFAGWFLYFAVKKIHNLGFKKTAITLFIILAPITSISSITGGLFGPIGIILYSLVPSIPAWFVWLIVRWLVARKTKLQILDDHKSGKG